MSPERMRRRSIHKVKLQSAMEYLMTYGWTILIIAVVLGVLYQMGAFSSSSSTVRVPSGACKVLRTSAATNLVGQCSGILPKYVAQFDGQSSYIDVGNPAALQFSGGSITTSVWINLNQCGVPGAVMLGHGVNSIAFYIQSCNLEWAKSNVANIGTGPAVQLSNWLNVVAVANIGSNILLYVNGVQSGPYAFAQTYTYTQNLRIGSSQSDAGFLFSGLISNVQIYNTSLDTAQIQRLYSEGIGGAPVNPQYVVGWWPLNGDAKDYSGNNNNGATTAITFVSQYGK
jgi:hypothetical protein